MRGASGERAQVNILALIASENLTEFRGILDQLLAQLGIIGSPLWL
jgi:hypothetical protein